MASFKRVREYVSQPYEHPGEGRLVQKLGKIFYQEDLQKKVDISSNKLILNRFLHFDILLSDVLYELS
jgi:hypothetical protein